MGEEMASCGSILQICGVLAATFDKENLSGKQFIAPTMSHLGTLS